MLPVQMELGVVGEQGAPCARGSGQGAAPIPHSPAARQAVQPGADVSRESESWKVSYIPVLAGMLFTERGRGLTAESRSRRLFPMYGCGPVLLSRMRHRRGTGAVGRLPSREAGAGRGPELPAGLSGQNSTTHLPRVRAWRGLCHGCSLGSPRLSKTL